MRTYRENIDFKNNRKESLKFRDEIIEKIDKELNIGFDFCFNDLYWIEKGEREVRRLKGGFGYWGKGSEFYNKRFLEVKEFVEGLSNDKFEVGFNKIRGEYSDCRNRMEKFKGMSLKEFKDMIKEVERTLILKIVYKKD